METTCWGSKQHQNVEERGFEGHRTCPGSPEDGPKELEISRERQLWRKRLCWCQVSEVRMGRLVGNHTKATVTQTTTFCNIGLQNNISGHTKPQIDAQRNCTTGKVQTGCGQNAFLKRCCFFRVLDFNYTLWLSAKCQGHKNKELQSVNSKKQQSREENEKSTIIVIVEYCNLHTGLLLFFTTKFKFHVKW